MSDQIYIVGFLIGLLIVLGLIITIFNPNIPDSCFVHGFNSYPCIVEQYENNNRKIE